jgi:hypothetical protein
MPTTWMIAPRIITPRNANKLRKPRQQLSGTATASNKNRFMAKYVVSGFTAPPNCSPPRRSDNAVQKISEPNVMSNAPRHINEMACPSDWVLGQILPQQILRHLYGIDDYAIGTHEAKRAPNSDTLGRATPLSCRPARLQCLCNHPIPYRNRPSLFPNKRISTQGYRDGRKDNSRCKLRDLFYSWCGLLFAGRRCQRRLVGRPHR